MPRRVGLPGASELFRSTSPDATAAAEPPAPAPAAPTPRAASPASPTRESPAPASHTGGPYAQTVDDNPEPTGRVRHDEKITVYVSNEELLALEQVRLTLRARHGLAVDRGRIVRAAIADALADLAENGGESALVKRLTGQ